MFKNTLARMRHELASLAMIESNDALLSVAHDRDLVLHLIGTHHGWGRPLPPLIKDHEPQTLSFSLGNHRMTASSDLVNSLCGAGYGGPILASRGAVRIPRPRVAGGDSALGRSSAERPGVGAMNGTHLTGLEGTNPLGFLAALGVQTVFSDEDEQPRALVEH